MGITLGLDICVWKQKDGADNGDNVPPREDERKCVVSVPICRVAPRAEGHHRGDLEEANLQSIGRADLHAEREFKHISHKSLLRGGDTK